MKYSESYAPFQSHSETSEAAAHAIQSKADTLRGMVYRWLLQNGTATDETMQEALGLNPSTQRPRRIELVDMGLVIDSGIKGTTRSGRSAVLWRAIPRTQYEQGRLF